MVRKRKDKRREQKHQLQPPKDCTVYYLVRSGESGRFPLKEHLMAHDHVVYWTWEGAPGWIRPEGKP